LSNDGKRPNTTVSLKSIKEEMQPLYYFNVKPNIEVNTQEEHQLLYKGLMN
jgi:hypothetical protein